jgi:hypothetical protein
MAPHRPPRVARCRTKKLPRAQAGRPLPSTPERRQKPPRPQLMPPQPPVVDPTVGGRRIRARGRRICAPLAGASARLSTPPSGPPRPRATDPARGKPDPAAGTPDPPPSRRRGRGRAAPLRRPGAMLPPRGDDPAGRPLRRQQGGKVVGEGWLVGRGRVATQVALGGGDSGGAGATWGERFPFNTSVSNRHGPQQSSTYSLASVPRYSTCQIIKKQKNIDTSVSSKEKNLKCKTNKGFPNKRTESKIYI